MGRKLDDMLSDFGCDLTGNDFREILADVFANMFPGMTDEDLIVRGADGPGNDCERFCGAVRARAGCNNLPGQFILRTLMNCRKASALYQGDEDEA